MRDQTKQKSWRAETDSDRRPLPPQGSALSTELPALEISSSSLELNPTVSTVGSQAETEASASPHEARTGASGPTRIRSKRDFLANLDRSGGMFACWPYMGPRDRDGYGRWFHKAAHRAAWALEFGESQLQVLHHCDNPPCCNLAHLYEGTHQDNMRDRNERKRTAAGVRNGHAKLTPEAVAVIRRWHGRAGMHRIARLFHIDHSTVRDIWKGRIWK